MRRIFIIIMIIDVVLTVAAVIALLLGRDTDDQANINNSNVVVANANQTVTINSGTNSAVIQTIEVTEQAELLGIARSFAERYGSWSSGSLSEYLLELKPWLTTAYSSVMRSTHESVEAAESLSSIASHSLSTLIKNWQAQTQAKVDVSVVRTEKRVGAPDVEYYETLSLTFIFQGGRWLVDGAEWKPSSIQPGGNGG